MHICKNPMENSFEIVKYFCSMRLHQTQGDLYLTEIKQGDVRTALGLRDNRRNQGWMGPFTSFCTSSSLWEKFCPIPVLPYSFQGSVITDLRNQAATSFSQVSTIQSEDLWSWFRFDLILPLPPGYITSWKFLSIHISCLSWNRFQNAFKKRRRGSILPWKEALDQMTPQN